jgi:glycosyltransferase involved in cell wall biosynthesis
MNIDLLHYSSPPVVGGVESVIGYHARMMANANHSVRILTGRGEAFDERVQVIPIPLLGSRHPQILKVKAELDRGQTPDDFYRIQDEIFGKLSEITSQTDILIAHNVCSLNKNLPLTAALYRLHNEKSSAPRLIIWHHDLAWTTPRYRSELHDGYPWDLLSRDWARATQVVVSESRRQELARLIGISPERIHVVPNGIDLQRFFKLEKLTIGLVHRLNLFKAAPLLLVPVRITPRKNLEMALQMVARLRSHEPQVVLIITGPLGPHNPANVGYFEELRALRRSLALEGSVYFLAELEEDFIPDPVIADFYRLSDALVLPSREEGFGIPILEAGATGIPIFCSDIPPLRELAGDLAVYFPPDGDPGMLASEIIDRLIKDPAYQLHVRVRNNYIWERVYRDKIEPLMVLQEENP